MNFNAIKHAKNFVSPIRITYFCAKLRKGEDMVKLIVIIFVIVFSAISAMNKATNKARRQQQGPARPIPPIPPQEVENFDDDFKFLYNTDDVYDEEKSSIDACEKDLKQAEKSVENNVKTVAVEQDVLNDSDNEAEIERWRRSIIDAEILKTKF